MESLIYVNKENVTAHCTPTGNGPPRVICTLLAQWQARFSFFVTGEDPAAVAGITLRCVLKEQPTGAVLLASSTASVSGAVYTFDFASVDSSGLRTLIGDADEIELEGEIEWTLSGRVERVYFPVTVLNSRHRPDDGAPDPADEAYEAWLSARAVRFDEAQTLTTEQKAQARANIGVSSSTGGSLPAGGTTGQVLAKQSNSDGDADWQSLGGAAALNVGTTSGTVCAGDDSRLTNSRAPTAHTHPQSDITGLSDTLAAKADLVGGKVPSSQIPFPISISNGGTGSTTAAAARVALGVSEIIAAVAQVVVVSVQNSATNSWAGEYVDIDDGTEVCRFWFTVDGSGTAPSAPSPGRLQVVAVSDGSSPTDVEAAFIIALSSQSAAFSAIPSYSGSFTVTNLTAGAAPGNGSSLPTDFSFSISTAGADAISRLAEANGSQLTNINAATIPGPLTTNLGGVYSSSGSPGQFVTGVATSGDLIYSALPTTAIANGGTGQTAKTAAFDALAPTTTKGDLIVHNGTNNIRVAVGVTNGHVLTVDSAQASGLKWAPSGADLDGWEMVQNATASASANIIFDSIFSSGYEWRIRIQDIRPATGTTVLYLLPRAGGADLGTTETGRGLQVFSSVGSASTSPTIATVGVIPMGSAFSNAFKSNFVFTWRPDTNTRAIVFDGFGSYNQASATVSGYFTGTVGIAAQPTGIKILFSSGNIAEGKFAVERRPITTIP